MGSRNQRFARIESLETTVGTTLFTRSVHGLKPTDQAPALGASARAMAHASEAFLRGATAGLDEPADAVRISVSEFVGVEVIPPMLARLAEHWPKIAIELELDNRGADLLEQQVDIAVRMFPPSQAALVAKKVGTIRVGFYAHADYLAWRGTPQRIEDLAGHRLIGPDRDRADLAAARAILPCLDRKGFILRTDRLPRVEAYVWCVRPE